MIFRTGRLTAIGALLASAIVVPLIADAGSEPSTADPLAPIALRGTVAGVDHLAPDSVKVQIAPDQQTVSRFDGTTSVFYSEVPGALVETSGNAYTIRIDPAAIPAQDISTDGIVNFDVYAEDPDRAVYSMTSASVRAVLTEDGTYGWTDPMSPTQDVDEVAARPLHGVVRTVTKASSVLRGVRARVSRPATRGVVCDSAGCATTRRAATARRVMLASATSRLRAKAIDDDETEDDDIDAPVISVLPKATSCPVGGLGIVYGTKRSVDATIGTAYPVGGDPAWMKAVSGASTEFTASFGVAYAKGSGGGSFNQSGTRSVERGVGFTWDHTTYARSFRVGVVYQRMEQMTGRCPGEKPDWTQEVPVAYSGGFGENTAGVTRPDWDQYWCVAQKSTGLWERYDTKGSSYTSSAGVKFASVIGIDLSVKRAYNADAVLSYNVGVVGRRMCGNGDYPGTAGKVMERLKK